MIEFLPFFNVKCLERFAGDASTSIYGLTSGFTVKLEPLVLLTSEGSIRFQCLEVLHKVRKMLVEP